MIHGDEIYEDVHDRVRSYRQRKRRSYSRTILCFTTTLCLLVRSIESSSLRRSKEEEKFSLEAIEKTTTTTNKNDDDDENTFLTVKESIKDRRLSSTTSMTIALNVGFRWCQACIRSQCECNFHEEECENCITTEIYEDYRNESLASGKMKQANNTNRLNRDDLIKLANGPKPGESMPPNSDPNSLDGNLADKRRQQQLINNLAQRINAESEKNDFIKAKTTANILYNKKSPEDIEELSLNATAKTKDVQRALDRVTNARDKKLNDEMKKNKSDEDRKHTTTASTTGNRTKRTVFDCAKDPSFMSDEAAVWCTGRHLDGRPSTTDGMIIV